MEGKSQKENTTGNLELLKFEYEMLQKEKLKNTNISYTFMGILIPVSMGILAYFAQANLYQISIFQLLAGALVSISALVIVYCIDRRLTYINKILSARMRIIERNINKNIEHVMQYNLLFPEVFKGEIKDDLKKEIEKTTEGKKWKKRVHKYFKDYIVIVVVAWIILLFIKANM